MTSEIPTGVFVLGMHRSGTSATTRGVNMLGVPVGKESELKAASRHNPTGYWEIPQLTAFNDDLLLELGGSSMGPPPLEPGWERRPALERKRERARSLISSVHPGPSWVWKDPRTCVTFPFWLEALRARPIVVLVHRDPLAIWRSLATRQGLSGPLALAVWERYLRSALSGVRGLPVILMRYSELVGEPLEWARAVGAFLDRHRVERHASDDPTPLLRFVERAESSDPDTGGEAPQLSTNQGELLATIESLAGAHDRFPEVRLPPETDLTEPLLAERRRADILRAQMKERIRSMRKRLREARAARRDAEAELEAADPGRRERRRRRRPGEVGTPSGRGRLPDFLIIGAQKSGTSSLYRWLGEASSIEVPRRKELHFFDLNFHEGVDWYRACFAEVDGPGAGSGSLTGEASPYYLFHPLAPRRAKETLPDARLIAVLRDPAARAVSHYYHEVGNGVEGLPLEAALEQEAERLAGEAERMVAEPGYESFNHRHFSYQARGVYVDQLRRWREVFPEDQLLVVKSERLFAEPRSELARVHEFLGIIPEPPRDPPPWNQRSYPSISPETERRLGERFAPDNARLYEYIGEDFGW